MLSHARLRPPSRGAPSSDRSRRVGPWLAASLLVGLAAGCGASGRYHTGQDWKAAPRQVADSGGNRGGATGSARARRPRPGSYFKVVQRARPTSAPRAESVQSAPRRPSPKPTSRVKRRPRRHRAQGRHARPNGARVTAKKFAGSQVSGKLSAKGGSGAPRQVYTVDESLLEPQDDAPQQVVYMGYLRLRVRQQLKTVDAITARVRKAGGYIERMGSRNVVVRIPAGDFDAAMATFASLGHVLARRVQALDVTAQFTDLDARLAVAKGARQRLLALLHTVKDVNERLRIVQEIKRLSERIERIDSTLGTLKNLIAFYTITIDLVAKRRGPGGVTHRSPFPWVRGLVAHRITLRGKRPQLDVAKGFVRFKKAKTWHARAADTAMIRAARLRNEPEGDTGFWAAALRHELLGRGEVALDQGDAGVVRWQTFRNRDVEPRVWLVAVRADGDRVGVVEAFFPTEKSWQRHRAAVLGTLSTLEVR